MGFKNSQQNSLKSIYTQVIGSLPSNKTRSNNIIIYSLKKLGVIHKWRHTILDPFSPATSRFL